MTLGAGRSGFPAVGRGGTRLGRGVGFQAECFGLRFHPRLRCSLPSHGEPGKLF